MILTAKQLEAKTKVGSIYKSPAGTERKVIATGPNYVTFKTINGMGGEVVYLFHDLITMNYKLIK